LAVLVLFASAAVRPVHADDPLAQKQMEVERQLGCPVCTSLPLNVCDNQICAQMKGVIHDQLAAGKTPDEVVAYFVARYGEGILLTPPRRGFNLAVWYLPFLALLAGAAIVWAVLRRSLERQRSAAGRLARVDPHLSRYRERVRTEVELLEGKN
jgi:cytochrome c-type biogenesis protein CcmH